MIRCLYLMLKNLPGHCSSTLQLHSLDSHFGDHMHLMHPTTTRGDPPAKGEATFEAYLCGMCCLHHTCYLSKLPLTHNIYISFDLQPLHCHIACHYQSISSCIVPLWPFRWFGCASKRRVYILPPSMSLKSSLKGHEPSSLVRRCVLSLFAVVGTLKFLQLQDGIQIGRAHQSLGFFLVSYVQITQSQEELIKFGSKR